MQSHYADQSDSTVAREQVCGSPSEDDSALDDATSSQTASLWETEKGRHLCQSLLAPGAVRQH